MALTNTFVKNCKQFGKHADGGGMYLLVSVKGKYWRMDYRFGGKRKTLALGVYDLISLAKARQRRDKAKLQLAEGIDPSMTKRDEKQGRLLANANTYELIAREFHRGKSDSWSKSYAEKWLRGQEKDLFPYIGSLQLSSITAPLLLSTLRRVESRGAIDSAHTLRQTAGQVFMYGVQTGRCERNPSIDLHGALKPLNVKHMAALLEPHKVGELLRAIDGYSGQPTTRIALVLSALLFQRPGNIRQMEWSWIDFDEKIVQIPSAEMKRTKKHKLNGRPHIVPLAPQALNHLNELIPLTGHGKYVFPSLRSGERPMSDNTVNAALRRMGFTQEEMSAHGFRATARTLMIERISGISADVIEAQLAHGKSTSLGMAYDRAEFLEQRRKMMLVWADYLDKLRVGAEVIQIRDVA